MKATALSLIRKLRALGPYVLVELFLPGGTLLAILLWVSSGGGRGYFADAPQPIPAAAAIEYVLRSERPLTAAAPD